MKSGISRYTIGGFNQSALDDVYNKAKEIYQDEAAPPASGVIANTVALIWDDMHEAPSAYPVASSMSYGQFQGAVYYNTLDASSVPLWGGTNVWYEVEEMSCEECPTWSPDEVQCWNCSCGFTITQSVNTMVELTPLYQAIRDDGVWRLTRNGSVLVNGGTQPSEHILFEENRGCNVTAIEDIRFANKGYSVKVGVNGINTLYVPKYYYRDHGFNPVTQTNYLTMDAVYVGQYARLVLIDPNGVDDRHLARFCIHVSSDRKQADGTQIPGQEGWGTGGISRYKMIPTNGDWMPVNYLVGCADEAELIANPPPFPTEPSPI